ncbi:hypothetical protein GCM10029963_36800 [Micromonospora andamanensis]
MAAPSGLGPVRGHRPLVPRLSHSLTPQGKCYRLEIGIYATDLMFPDGILQRNPHYVPARSVAPRPNPGGRRWPSREVAGVLGCGARVGWLLRALCSASPDAQDSGGNRCMG